MAVSGSLDRRVQFQRAEVADDGLSPVETFENYGNPVPARKADISDGERWRAGAVEADLTTRFVIRWSSFSRSLTARDRLTCDGETYNIVGIKETRGRRQWLEITAARIDG